MEKQTTKPSKYPDEIRKSAVEMFIRSRADFRTRIECAKHIAELLGIGTYKTVLIWVRQYEADSGLKEGLSTDERDELRRLRKDNLELRRVNGILKAASAFFAAEFDRPHNK